VFVARVDSIGAHLWSKSLGTSFDQCPDSGPGCDIALTTTASGDPIVVATAAGELDFGDGVLQADGETDIFVARLDPQGQPLWTRRFGGPGAERATVAHDPGGRIVVGGGFSQTMVLSSSLTLSSAGDRDAFVMELDPATGDVLWAKAFGDTGGRERAFRMSPDVVDPGLAMASPLAKRKVMVTGGAGFLGVHLCERLRARGVTDIVVPRSREHDLCDGHQTAALFEATRPEVVFHLAAQVGGIGANRNNPGAFFHGNMAMGLHVLEQARRFSTDKVVIAGTVCAYPKFCPVPFKEDDLWNGYPEETNAPYGIAKKALLVMAQGYRAQYGCNFVMLFPVNLYGPRDNFDLETSHVIPAMIRKFDEARDKGEPSVTLWGDGTPTREFLYVDDAAEGLIVAAERYDHPDPVNLGAGFEISMRELADKIQRAVGYQGSVVWDTSKPNGQPRRMLDVSRARERFGFSAQISLDEGLARTIAWYREHG
jgi:GDP-L-fucose synthase